MRHIITIALAMLVSVSVTDDAWAGKKDKDKGSDTAEGDLEMEESGIDSVDELFAKAQEPMNSIREARMKVDAVAPALNQALGLPEGTPFSDALADLKSKAEGKLEVAVNDQGVPTITPADGMPENVKGAVDGLNTGVKEAVEATMKLSEVPQQVQDVIAAAKSFDPTSIKPVTKVPKATKVLGTNLKVLGRAPGEVEALVQSVDNMKKDLLGTLKG